MKKNAPKRMRLCRETLRYLSDDQTREAAGNASGTCTKVQTCFTCGVNGGAGPNPYALCG